MAEEVKNTKNSVLALQNISEAPLLRQVGLAVGLAASVALGVAIVLWSQSPDYTMLYSGLPDTELSQVTESLKQSQIKYKLSAGGIMVPAAEVETARMQLASQGLPNIRSKGFDILNEDQGFGTSQFIQAARYQHALEQELGRSISAIRSVKSAIVHLALPKDSVFVRDRKKASAAVMVNLFSGHRMTDDQISAISYMVASSVPNLQVKEVTVVDQMGRLLTEMTGKERLLNTHQLEYTSSIEQNYINNVNNILSPFLGRDGFKAQISADIDFTRVEKTSEVFNPDVTATRSKQKLSEQVSGNGDAGVPGALSNQPPGGAFAPESATGENISTTGGNGAFKNKESVTENFELDKTISHIQLSTGNIKRISIAVVVDNVRTVAEDGQVSDTPRTDDELNRITALVKEAVGFNAQRGDTVNIINASFVAPITLEALPDIPIWEQSWFAPLVKQVLAGLVVLYIIFGVIKPAFNNLAHSQKEILAIDGKGAAGQIALEGGSGVADMNAAKSDALPKPPNEYEIQLDRAKKLVIDDPKIAAQVVKNWMEA